MKKWCNIVFTLFGVVACCCGEQLVLCMVGWLVVAGTMPWWFRWLSWLSCVSCCGCCTGFWVVACSCWWCVWCAGWVVWWCVAGKVGTVNGTNSIGLPRMCAPPPPNAPVSSLHLFCAFLVLDNSFTPSTVFVTSTCYYVILLLYCTFFYFVKHCRRRRQAE